LLNEKANFKIMKYGKTPMLAVIACLAITILSLLSPEETISD